MDGTCTCTLDIFSNLSPKSSPHTKDLVHVSTNHGAIYHSQKVLHEIFLFLDGNMFLWNEYLSYACNNGKQYLKICCDFKKWFVFKNINKINKYIIRKIKHIYIYRMNNKNNKWTKNSIYIYSMYIYICIQSIISGGICSKTNILQFQYCTCGFLFYLCMFT